MGRSHLRDILPLEEKRRQGEETRLGVTALEREVQRLELILRVVQDLEHNLRVLATWVSCRGQDCVCRQNKLQEWLGEPLFHQPLKDYWNELLASSNEGEKKLPIKVTTEWCER